jgi:hypothetical protein
MKPHPLEQPALARFRLLQARGQRTQAKEALWQALAQLR